MAVVARLAAAIIPNLVVWFFIKMAARVRTLAASAMLYVRVILKPDNEGEI